MKNLYLIGGTMGIGKTSVCQYLKNELSNSVFLDGDWCWDACPFQVTEETKKMVLDNICFLLNNFIHCSVYSNVIFCWVMHKQDIIDTILSRLDSKDCCIRCISLISSKETLRERIMNDISKGFRTPDAIDRSISRLPLYQKMNTIKINTTGKTVSEIAHEIQIL